MFYFVAFYFDTSDRFKIYVGALRQYVKTDAKTIYEEKFHLGWFL